MENSGIPNSFLEELKQKNNIVSVISRYVPLERKGKNYWARCPFHGEKTPSFSVNEVDQYYHCFGCKAGGNIFKFVMEMESVSFAEAVKMIADWSNMEMPNTYYENGKDYKKEKEERDKMVECMKAVAKHYHENLINSKFAKEYLFGRGIHFDMINKFGLGYSVNYNEIIDYMNKKGYNNELLLKCGVIKEKDGRPYDAYGERIIFPVINIYGEVVAFSGRTTKKVVEYGKYINTAETKLFSKSKNLFAINLVKKYKKQNPGKSFSELIICEGQTDVIAMHKAGYNNAIASLGTALTVDQARLIKRFADKVVICYDGDFAGQKATLRGLDILKHEKLNVRVASLPDGMDPDEVIRQKGKTAFDRIIEDALPLIEFKLKYFSKIYDLKDMDGKVKFLEAALDALRELGEVEAEVYLDLVREYTGANKEFLRDKLYKNKDLKLTEAVSSTSVVKREVKNTDVGEKAEICVLANILRNKDYVTISAKLKEYFFGEHKVILEYLLDNKPTIDQFIEKFKDHEKDIVGEILNYDFFEDPSKNKQQYEDCLWRIYRAYLSYNQSLLFEKLKSAEGNEKKEIMKKLQDIIQKINSRRVDL